MKYTIDQLKEAVKSSISFRQVLGKLNLAEYGGNYATLKRKCQQLNIDTTHFTGQAHNRGKRLPVKTSTEEYTNNNLPIGSYRLKRRLLADSVLQPICQCCQLTEWLGKPIPLELDHIDGNNSNNNLNNLRLLCPNCHALTDTYRGKNQQRAKKT